MDNLGTIWQYLDMTHLGTATSASTKGEFNIKIENGLRPQRVKGVDVRDVVGPLG